MERERRRARLTPLSGELKAAVEWTPVDPAAEKPKRRRRRKERKLPTTRAGVILYGLGRFALIAGGLIGVTALVAGVIVWLGGGSAAGVFPLAFYLAGAGLGAMAVLGGTRMYSQRYYLAERPQREQAFNMSFAYGFLGVLLFGLGLLLDYLL